MGFFLTQVETAVMISQDCSQRLLGAGSDVL